MQGMIRKARKYLHINFISYLEKRILEYQWLTNINVYLLNFYTFVSHFGKRNYGNKCSILISWVKKSLRKFFSPYLSVIEIFVSNYC